MFQSKVLSEDHKTHLEQEIKTLSGTLKAQYDQVNKEYEGNFSFLISVTLLKYLTNIFLLIKYLLLIPNVFLLDLPASTPLIDLDKMADLDMGKLSK